jgi:hypothetical protein
MESGNGSVRSSYVYGSKICEVPHHVTSMQWILLIREYFDKHPAELGEQGAVLVPRIVYSAFPAHRERKVISHPDGFGGGRVMTCLSRVRRIAGTEVSVRMVRPSGVARRQA